MDLKDGLAQLQSHLGELETAARKLDNQNFADLIKLARGRLSQAAEHPDVEAVGELLRRDLDDGQEKLPFPSGSELPKDPSANAHGLGPDTAGGQNPSFVAPQSDGA